MLRSSIAFIAYYPRSAALLGVLWLGLRLSRGLGINEAISLDDFQAVYLKAQQKGYLHTTSHFEFERDQFPFPYSIGIENCFSLLDSRDLVIFEDGRLLFPQSVSSTFLPLVTLDLIDLEGVVWLWMENLRNFQPLLPS